MAFFIHTQTPELHVSDLSLQSPLQLHLSPNFADTTCAENIMQLNNFFRQSIYHAIASENMLTGD